jgi:hypothetical protein
MVINNVFLYHIEYDWNVKNCHFYWKINACADALTNMSCD